MWHGDRQRLEMRLRHPKIWRELDVGQSSSSSSAKQDLGKTRRGSSRAKRRRLDVEKLKHEEIDERQTMGLCGHHFHNGPVERWLVWIDEPQRTEEGKRVEIQMGMKLRRNYSSESRWVQKKHEMPKPMTRFLHY